LAKQASLLAKHASFLAMQASLLAKQYINAGQLVGQAM
jgi:hypothetical protein